MEAYGNANLLHFNGYQYIAYAGTSEESADLNENTCAVELYASTDAWVTFGVGTQTAAAPSGEKTRTTAVFKIIGGTTKLFPVPLGTTDAPVTVGVIQVSTGGTLEIWERRA